MKKRGQSGIEYIILISLLLFFFIPLIHYSLRETTTQVKFSQIDSFVGRVSRSVNTVHSMGPGALSVVSVTIPPGVVSAQFVNTPFTHEIVMQITHQGSQSDMHATVQPAVDGTLPISPGTYHLRVLSVNTTSVNITIN